MKSERERDAGKITAGQLKLTAARTEVHQEGGVCQIIFVKTGSCAASGGGVTLNLNAGSVLLLGRACRCTMQAVGHGPSETVGCAFPQSFFHEMYAATQKDYGYIFSGDRPVVLHGTVQLANRLRTLLELLRGSLQEPDCPGEMYLALILHYIEREYSTESRSSARPHNDTVERICAYLAANYTQKLTLSEVAAQFYLSPYYLSRLFRRVTGQSIVDYINGQRIEAAQHLLEETDLSINAVAEQTGFSTAAHFRRVFRELLGVGPQQYRKDHRGGQD